MNGYFSKQTKRQLRLFKQERGLTLIELLVSLVILGFVVTIMSGAFSQVAAVVRIAESANAEFQPQWLKINSIKELVANLTLPKEVEKPFEGDEKEFAGYTLSLPQDNWGELHQFKISLVKNSSGGNDLLLDSEGVSSTVIGSWSIPVKFEYLTENGQASSMWPPLVKGLDDMPSGVVLRATYGEQLVQMIIPYNGVKQIVPDYKNNMGKLFGLDLK